MKTIIFNPSGGPLTAKAVFLGDMLADYGMFLKEKDSNSQTIILEGDNVNPAEDSVPLPTPVVLNNGRRVKLETGYYGNHPDVNKDYEIRLEIFQDGQLIGFEVDKSSPDNTLAANAKFSLILVKLSI
jgi:hypothetical protein